MGATYSWALPTVSDYNNTLEYTSYGSGITLPAGQNYNIGQDFSVGAYNNGHVECEILENHHPRDNASLYYNIIPC